MMSSPACASANAAISSCVLVTSTSRVPPADAVKGIPMIVITPLAQDALEQGLNATRQKAVDRLKERCYCLTLLNTSRNKQLTKERKEKMEKLLGM